MKVSISYRSLSSMALLAALLPACSSVKVWPFNDGAPSTSSRTPANSTEYQCDSGKHFYVRTIDNGNAVWLIYPDREVALNKTTSSTGTRYTNGVATLDIKGNEATLADGPLIAYAGCKAVMKK